MEELFNKPILDQMYWFRKEDFEQYIYDKNKEIQEIEGKVCDNAEFPQEQELKDKQRKLDSINAELKINDDDHEILGDIVPVQVKNLTVKIHDRRIDIIPIII